MSIPEPKRRAGDVERPAAARGRRRDRISALLATSALLLAVALVAVPLAVDSLFDPSSAPAPLAPAEPATTALPFDAVSAILSPGASGPMPDAAVMARRLGNLGESAIPVVVGMLCGEIALPEVEEGTWDQPIHAEALAKREQALLESLRYFRSRDVVLELRKRGVEGSFEVRLVCARLLGENATLEAQTALLDVFARFSPADLAREYACSTLEGALARCLQRDPAAMRELSKRVQKLDPALLPLLARSVGRTRGPQSAEFLARLLGRSAALDTLAMKELARVSDSTGMGLSDSALADVRRLLEHDGIDVQRTAITVLGRAGDRRSFDALLTRMNSSDRLVSAAARWSLRTLAGKDLGSKLQDWVDWSVEQDLWWSERYDGVRAQLGSLDPAQVFAALRELSERTYFRHEIAADIGPLAVHAEPAGALAAIAALERLGSRQAVPWLVEALEGDTERRAAAAAALRALTGWELPAEHSAWAGAIADFTR